MNMGLVYTSPRHLLYTPFTGHRIQPSGNEAE
ncbi:MAG: hypothetical protein KatS3mg022_3683 [Armatimonadota bacterium]|nr:MAG: hypothetical protein KatS3mg022_3683 [Armatimonadota bacterium]